jgi:hypothetical protein
MVKAVERGMRIEDIHLVEKRGGKSGHYRARVIPKKPAPDLIRGGNRLSDKITRKRMG